MDGRTDWHCFVRLDLLVPKGRVVCGRNSVVECQLPKLDVEGSNPFARFFRVFVVMYGFNSLGILIPIIIILSKYFYYPLTFLFDIFFAHFGHKPNMSSLCFS